MLLPDILNTKIVNDKAERDWSVDVFPEAGGESDNAPAAAAERAQQGADPGGHPAMQAQSGEAVQPALPAEWGDVRHLADMPCTI